MPQSLTRVVDILSYLLHSGSWVCLVFIFLYLVHYSTTLLFSEFRWCFVHVSDVCFLMPLYCFLNLGAVSHLSPTLPPLSGGCVSILGLTL